MDIDDLEEPAARYHAALDNIMLCSGASYMFSSGLDQALNDLLNIHEIAAEALGKPATIPPPDENEGEN